MYSHKIAYTDFNNEHHEETFYFNLSKGDIIEMELGEEGGLEGLMDRLIKEKDRKKLVALFRSLIEASVGKRSDDGRKFIKNDAIREDFMFSGAYSEFILELLSEDETVRAAFVKEIFPSDGSVHSKEELVADMKAASAEFEKRWNGESVK